MNVIEIGRKTLQIEADALMETMRRLDEQFEKAVDMILACKGRVVITGMGKSGIIGKKIAATFSSTGTPSMFLHPAEGVHGDLGMLVRGDVVIGISNSGETDELRSILPILKRLDVKLISIVGKVNSTLAQKADCVLDAGVLREACPLNLAPTASTTVALALGDALAVALLEKRGFKAEDFALFHPSGALGKKLLLTVEDLYHTGEKLPVVLAGSEVARAVFTISSGGFGCTAVVDGEGNLQGIVTDGDLRRGLEKYPDLFSRTVDEVMTKTPKTIDITALAATALQQMESRSITSLLVTENGKLCGIIHLHDILRAGLV